MKLVSLPIAGAGGRMVRINPEQVVCLVDVGDNRTQVVTTGFTAEASISLVVHLPLDEVSKRLLGD
jgi:hypothetical protein